MQMLRRTKIVATLGPASDSKEIIRQMIISGVNVVRLNFSHGMASDHIKRAEIVREIAESLGVPIGILCDLQGPKIRIGKFAGGSVVLQEGGTFLLDANCTLGDEMRVGLDYKSLPNEVEVDTILLLDDGRIELKVLLVVEHCIHCKVVVGGILSNNKGINKKGGGLAAKALTSKDESDIKTAVALAADFIAISFPRSAADVELARQLVREAGGVASIIAKIERAEAIVALEEIINASDAVMVARGDLGVEVGDARVPGLQKQIIRLARLHHKPVITATQMMESMINSPIPTRAEVSDVANAVLDGTDAVMLSAETASGQFPIQTIQAVNRTVLDAEKEYFSYIQPSLPEDSFIKTDESIAMAAIYTAQHLKVKAIATLTQSGNTAQWLSCADNAAPIYALSPDKKARTKLTLCRGVYPYPIEHIGKNRDEILREMQDVLLQHQVVSIGDTVILTFGEPIGCLGGTNTFKIVNIHA